MRLSLWEMLVTLKRQRVHGEVQLHHGLRISLWRLSCNCSYFHHLLPEVTSWIVFGILWKRKKHLPLCWKTRQVFRCSSAQRNIFLLKRMQCVTRLPQKSKSAADRLCTLIANEDIFSQFLATLFFNPCYMFSSCLSIIFWSSRVFSTPLS